MPLTHPLIAWLVEHVSFVRLTAVVGRDGKTDYSKIRGTEHNLRLPFFGERVRYKGRLREGGVAGEGTRWSDGIFVGTHRKTNQYLMFEAHRDIRKARTVMRFPDVCKLFVGQAQAVNITPQHVHDSSVHDEAFRESGAGHPSSTDPRRR